MSGPLRRRSAWSAASVLLSLPLAGPLAAQADGIAPDSGGWDVTRPRGETRVVEFTTAEGTWMSVDESPDGRWLAFDLLGHIYRLPAEGGAAENLTESSGLAVNYHPRISPDGGLIAFVSDRDGQTNLWVMNADGTAPRIVSEEPMARVVEPAWTPDGQYILVRRSRISQAGSPGGSGLWMYHRDGGKGIELVGEDESGAAWPAVSPDGRHVFFHASDGGGRRDALAGSWQLRRLDLRTGEVLGVTTGVAAQQSRGSSGGAYAAEVSPDGRFLAFARRIPDGTVSFRGHRFGPRTALWLRDLVSGSERVLMDPITVDNAEGIKTLRILPGYDWAADGRSIVLSQGGRLRRLDVATGGVTTIPFTATVRRELSQQARARVAIPDGPFGVRFLRWASTSPDGRRLVFQAVGRVWLMDLPGGTPRRLTPAAASGFEFAPAWAPDGRSVAYTTWTDGEGGHLWRVPADGGSPRRLTETAAEYLNPVWSPDGRLIVVARGTGAALRGRGAAWNPYWELVSVPGAGGAAETISAVPGEGWGSRMQVPRASFGPEERLFFPVRRRSEGAGEQYETAVVSVRTDGSDRRTHLTLAHADEAVVSPDGRWLAFQEGDNAFVAPFPWPGTGGETPLIARDGGPLPVRPLSTEGGLFPRWRDAGTVDFVSGARHFVHHVASERTDTFTVDLRVEPRTPSGSIALRGARIVTLGEQGVLEAGTILVAGSRIRCVGECDVSAADRVLDLEGHTVIPGFVDMHAHHYREHRGINPQRDFESAIYLAYGVTTNLDNSMWSQAIFPTAELIRAGLVVGPRTFSTGDPLYRGDGPRQNELTSYEVAERNVNRLASWGATGIKQYLQPRRQQRQWVAEATRRAGLMLTSEGGDLPYTVGMVADGHTGFEHPLSYLPLHGDATRFLGEAGAVYSPTFIVGGIGPWNEEYFFAESDLWRDEKQRRFMPWRQLVPHTRRRMLRPDTDYSYPFIAEGLADVIRYGGGGAIGSHGQAHGIGSHWEIWMAASALGPLGALELASLHGARFLGAEADLGSIEPGKLADLVVLGSNPLDDVRNTTDITQVMQGGILYDGDTLDELWPESRPYGEGWWLDEDAWRSDDRPVEWFDRTDGDERP